LRACALLNPLWASPFASNPLSLTVWEGEYEFFSVYGFGDAEEGEKIDDLYRTICSQFSLSVKMRYFDMKKMQDWGKKMENTSHPILRHGGFTLFPVLLQFIPRTVDFFLSSNGPP